MAFTVLNTVALEQFAKKHADSRRPLANWLGVVQAAAWTSLVELRQAFPSADGVNIPVAGGLTVVVTVFNIKGNSYRLIAVVNYESFVCRITHVLTHAEYSAGRWKNQI